MKRLLALLAACGGGTKAAPPPEPPAPVVSAKSLTRVPVEDSELPEEGVTILNSKGHMEQAAVQDGIKPHESELSDCYMTKVGRRRWLGGHVVLKWNIKADGTVTKVLLSESDLGSWDVEKCLLEAARAATFDRPSGGDADFTVPLDFSAKGSAQIWDEDKSLRAIGGQLAKLDSCPDAKELKKAKKPMQAAPKNVTVTLYVGPHGKAQSVGFSSPSAEITDEWATCAAKAANGWRLPDPRGQIAKLAIRYKPVAGGEEAER